MIRGQIFVKKDSSSQRMKYPQDFPALLALPTASNGDSTSTSCLMETETIVDTALSSQQPNLNNSVTQNS